MYIYSNGAIVAKEEATISPFDHGYMYGLGVFETFRIEDGHPFLLDDHLRRLKHGVETIGIDFSISREEALNILTNLLEANNLTTAYVRFNVSAGVKELGLYEGTYEEPTVIVYMKPVAPIQQVTKEAIILKQRRNTPEGDVRLKSHHFLNNVLGKRELGNNAHAEGIFLTEDGYVAEGVVSNVFWLKDDTIFTPAVETGILDGVTRQFLLTLFNKLAIRTESGFFPPEHLQQADAAFITNSIQEIVPIHRCGKKRYETNHPLIKEIRESFCYYRKRLWSRNELLEERSC